MIMAYYNPKNLVAQAALTHKPQGRKRMPTSLDLEILWPNVL